MKCLLSGLDFFFLTFLYAFNWCDRLFAGSFRKCWVKQMEFMVRASSLTLFPTTFFFHHSLPKVVFVLRTAQRRSHKEVILKYHALGTCVRINKWGFHRLFNLISLSIKILLCLLKLVVNKKLFFSMSPFAHCVKMTEDCFHIIFLPDKILF